MLENILEQINKNLERIANALEQKEEVAPKTTTKRKTKKDVEDVKEVVEPAVTQIQNVVQAPVMQNIPTNEPVVPSVVPINVTPETYTQEEIARAMSSAMDTGKQNVVFGILQAFNTNSLMGIDPSKYGEVARMLREAGIKI